MERINEMSEKRNASVIKAVKPSLDPLEGRDGITSVSRSGDGKVLVIVLTNGEKITDPDEIRKILETVE